MRAIALGALLAAPCAFTGTEALPFGASSSSQPSGFGMNLRPIGQSLIQAPASIMHRVAAAVTGGGSRKVPGANRRRLQEAHASGSPRGGLFGLNGGARPLHQENIAKQATEAAETLLAGLQVTTLPGLIDSIPVVGNMLSTVPTSMGIRGRYPVNAHTGYEEQLPPVSNVVQNLMDMGALNRNIMTGLNEFTSGFRLSQMLTGFLDGVLGLPTSANLGSATPAISTDPGRSIMFTPFTIAENNNPFPVNGYKPTFGQTVFGSRVTSGIHAPIANIADVAWASGKARAADIGNVLTGGLLGSTGITSLFTQFPSSFDPATGNPSASNPHPELLKQELDRILNSREVLIQLKAAFDAEIPKTTPGAFALSTALERKIRGDEVLEGSAFNRRSDNTLESIVGLQQLKAIVGDPKGAEGLQQRIAQAALYSGNAGADLDNLLGLMSGFLTMPLDLAFKGVNLAFSTFAGMPSSMFQLSGGLGSLLNLRQVLQGLPITWMFTQQQTAAVEQAVASIDRMIGQLEKMEVPAPGTQAPAQLAQGLQRELLNIGTNVMKLNGTQLIPRMVVGGLDLGSVFGSMWAQPLGYMTLDFAQMFGSAMGMFGAGMADMVSAGATSFGGMFDTILSNFGMSNFITYATNAFLSVPNMFMDAVGLGSGVRGIQAVLGNSMNQLNGLSAASPEAENLFAVLDGQSSTNYLEEILLKNPSTVTQDDVWELAKVIRLQSLEHNVRKLTEALQEPTKQVTEGFGFQVDDLKSAFTQSLGAISSSSLNSFFIGNGPEAFRTAISRIPIIGSISDVAIERFSTGGFGTTGLFPPAVETERTFGTIGLNSLMENVPFGVRAMRPTAELERPMGLNPFRIFGMGAPSADTHRRLSAVDKKDFDLEGLALAASTAGLATVLESINTVVESALNEPCVPATQQATVRLLRALSLARNPIRLLQAAGVEDDDIQAVITGEVPTETLGMSAVVVNPAEDAVCTMKRDALRKLKSYAENSGVILEQIGSLAPWTTPEDALMLTRLIDSFTGVQAITMASY